MSFAIVEHSDAPLGEIHAPYNWSFANSSTRQSAGAYVSGDVGKWAYQRDTSTIWHLVSYDGGGVPTWIQVGGEGTLVTGDKNHLHTQTVAAFVWYIEHLMGKIPSIVATDNNGTQLYGTVQHPDLDHSTITYGVLVSGRASCN